MLLLGALFAVIGLSSAGWVRRASPDREREALAREEFERTGSWPDGVRSDAAARERVRAPATEV